MAMYQSKKNARIVTSVSNLCHPIILPVICERFSFPFKIVPGPTIVYPNLTNTVEHKKYFYVVNNISFFPFNPGHILAQTGIPTAWGEYRLEEVIFRPDRTLWMTVWI